MARIPYKKHPALTASLALVALFGTAAGANIALDTIAQHEGYVEQAYQDPVGIWTKCFGDTYDVTPGMTYTAEQCVQSLNRQVLDHARPVFKCIPDLASQHDLVKAAMVSMAYNIGTNGFCKSQVASKANAGDWAGACQHMAKIYTTARGKTLPGLVKRRKAESDMCLRGLALADSKEARQ